MRAAKKTILMLLALTVPAPARAQIGPTSAPASQPGSLPTADKPWARGVSAGQRARALALYREGNRLFADEKYSEALARYERAIQHWSHPGIHYNMVECLVNLGRNLEAYGHLKAAMRFGEAPLGGPLFRQARTYLNMLERSLARVRVVCREPGAKVVLDGKALFVGPGEATRLVEPGVHAVLATKAGYIPMAQQPNLAPGKLTEVTLRLMPRRTEIVVKRRWQRRWLPWTILGAGAVIAATALPLYLVARRDFDDHETGFNELCNTQPAGGCVPEQLTGDDIKKWSALEDLERRATSEYHASIGLLSAGAALAATGAVLVILNLPQAVERPVKVPNPKASVAISPSIGGLGLSFTF
jgi:tetratricopeptide (TPR) repeat protein